MVDPAAQNPTCPWMLSSDVVPRRIEHSETVHSMKITVERRDGIMCTSISLPISVSGFRDGVALTPICMLVICWESDHSRWCGGESSGNVLKSMLI